jgi:hypothetical protein
MVFSSRVIVRLDIKCSIIEKLKKAAMRKTSCGGGGQNGIAESFLGHKMQVIEKCVSVQRELEDNSE